MILRIAPKSPDISDLATDHIKMTLKIATLVASEDATEDRAAAARLLAKLCRKALKDGPTIRDFKKIVRLLYRLAA